MPIRIILHSVIAIATSANVVAEIDFAHEVVPLLKSKCIECHGGDESKGGFSMNTRALVLEADVLEPGKPDKSILMDLLLTDDEDERMPPPKKQKHPLDKKEVDVFRRWIAAGVPWEDGVTFAKERYEPPLRPREVKLPKGVHGAQAIDYLVSKSFRENKTAVPSLVDDAVFLRRLHLDVTGLPPDRKSRELLSEGKLDRAAAVERVLNNNQAYAEHWMVFWNDLLRNEFSGTGYIDGGRQQITGWLYRALLENKSYDVFVRELISPVNGSGGFMRGFKWRGEVNASQTREIQFSQNISQVFLGINMKCASCHDSFINQWTLKDAYSLAAITSEKPLEMFRCDKPTGKVAKPAWIYPELGDIDPGLPRKKRLKRLAELMTHPENGRMQRTIVNRIWKQLMGRGIVHPVETMNAEPWSEDLLDYLANTLTRENYDLKAVMRVILNSDAYRMESEKVKQEEAGEKFRGPVSRRLTAEQFIDAIRVTTGVWPKPDGNAFKKGARGGQLRVVMEAHGMKKWDNRPLRAVFTPRDQLQAALGRPNREQVVTSRPELFTTLEAMNLANGDALARILREGAAALIKKFPDRDKLIEHVYAVALTREPTQREWTISRSLLGAQLSSEGTEDFLWMIFMLPEFNYVD